MGMPGPACEDWSFGGRGGRARSGANGFEGGTSKHCGVREGMDEALKDSWPSTAAGQPPDVTDPVPLDKAAQGRESGAAPVQRQLH